MCGGAGMPLLNTSKTAGISKSVSKVSQSDPAFRALLQHFPFE